VKKKAKVAANRTPKVRRPSLLERIEETEDFMSNFDEELGKLQTSNGALANRISAIEALPDVDALAKRVGALERPSPLLLDIEKKVAELEAAERIFKKGNYILNFHKKTKELKCGTWAASIGFGRNWQRILSPCAKDGLS
jgi:hypothetical protein